MAKRWIIGILAIAVIAAGVLVVRERASSDDEALGDSVRQARIERGEMVVSVSATGSIVAKTEVNLSFDLPGKVAEVWAEVGDMVKPGAALARLDDTSLAFQTSQAAAALAAAQAQLDQLTAGPRQEEIKVAEANLAAAQAALEGAQASLGDLEAGADEKQIAAAAANLEAAEASVLRAQIQRDQVATGPSAAEIAVAESQVAAALLQQKVARDAHDQTMRCVTVSAPNGTQQEICPGLGMPEEQARFNLYAADQALAAAQAQLDQLLAGATQNQLESAQTNIAAAEAQRDAAQAQLDLLAAGASAGQLAAAQANVAAATAQRDAARAQLDLLLAGASQPQVAAARANVDQAQAALDMVQAELAKATLVAPWGGVVTAVNVRSGQIAPVSLPAVAMANVSELQIIVDVDEIDVGRISEGLDVTIRVDALPDEVISGRIKRIAPAASQVGGVVVYRVTIVLDETALPLRVGMSTAASIIVERLDDVLLVPNWAIRIDRDTGKTFVNLLVADAVMETELQVGVRGEDLSQVLSGLQEGDVVVAGDVVGLRQLLEREE